MSRPTDDVLQDAENADIGRCGCLIPSDEVTEGAETDEDHDE